MNYMKYPWHRSTDCYYYYFYVIESQFVELKDLWDQSKIMNSSFNSDHKEERLTKSNDRIIIRS